MLRTVSLIGLTAFALGLAIGIPRLWRTARAVRGRPWGLALAWALMFIALGVFEKREDQVLGMASLDQSAWFQVTCVSLAGTILIFLSLRKGVLSNLTRLPVLLLVIYGLLGMLSAVYSPAPQISAYKGALILLDAILVCVAITYLRGHDSRFILNLTYFMITIFAASALLGVILNPDLALRPSKGLLGAILAGSYPMMNSNELGFLAAVASVVAFNRFFARGPLSNRLYWGAQLALGLAVIFLAQARTAIASFAICVFLLSVVVPGRRWMSVIMGTLMLAVGSYAAVTGELPGWSTSSVNSTVEYLQRGQTESGLQSLLGRASLWSRGSKMLGDAPILGHGYDTGVRYGASKYGLVLTHMHNSHMQILANSGILGYLVWALMVGSVSWLVVRRFVKVHWPVRTEDDRFYVEMCAVLLLILMRTATGQVLVTHQWALMLFLGMVVYYYNEREDSAHAWPKSVTRVGDFNPGNPGATRQSPLRPQGES